MGIDIAAKSDSEAIFAHLKHRFEEGARLSSAGSEDPAVVLKEILQKISFAVTDGAGPVVRGIELFQDWRKEKCGEFVGDMLWIHCNAHMVPALDTAVTEALKDVEKMMELKDHVCRKFNESFFSISSSVVTTINQAIFKNVGPSNKNEEWAVSNLFDTYLKDKGEVNRFFNPLNSRFGKVVEMGMIIAYNLPDLQSFFREGSLPNRMYQSCKLYVECPFLNEICHALAVIYYHVF